MASTPSLNGKWRLYGTENADLFGEAFNLPARIASTLVHLRPREEVHVNGDDVHIRVDVPAFELPGYTVEKNIQIGQSSSAPLVTTGTIATGPLRKVSETLWESILTCEDTGKSITVTREIVGGEMWVTIQASGTKMTHKYERADPENCAEDVDIRRSCPSGSVTCACSTPVTHRASRAAESADALTCPADVVQCPAGASACVSIRSPFVGTWFMYGSEGGDQFYAARNVPTQIRQYLSHMNIVETIHVNGSHVHIRICVAPVCVPPRVHEISWTFNGEYNYVCPFTGSAAQGKAKKESDTKWINEITGLKIGPMTITRELRNDEMWLTFKTEKCQIVRKFERHNHSHHEHGEHHKHHGRHNSENRIHRDSH